MTEKEPNRNRRKSARRTEGEGVPPRSATVPEAGSNDARGGDERVRQPARGPSKDRDRGSDPEKR